MKVPKIYVKHNPIFFFTQACLGLYLILLPLEPRLVARRRLHQKILNHQDQDLLLKVILGRLLKPLRQTQIHRPLKRLLPNLFIYSQSILLSTNIIFI